MKSRIIENNIISVDFFSLSQAAQRFAQQMGFINCEQITVNDVQHLLTEDVDSKSLWFTGKLNNAKIVFGVDIVFNFSLAGEVDALNLVGMWTEGRPSSHEEPSSLCGNCGYFV